jgi:predicted Na+-dependent transporter
MKKIIFIIVAIGFILMPLLSIAQCSMCTKTAQQLGEKPAQGLNSGILYLMLTPFAVMGVIAYRWWKNEKEKSSV